MVTASLADLGPAFVVLGSGEARYEHMWRTLAARRPDRFGVRLGFDEHLAHLIEGGADMFLMPSRYEPCGLNQMYSLRYGTVPIVRATGGLVDSVVPWDGARKKGTGFLFADYSGDAMLAAPDRGRARVRGPQGLDAAAAERHEGRLFVGQGGEGLRDGV